MKYVDFSQALRAIKEGKLAYREGWAGAHEGYVFIYYVPASNFVVNRPPLKGIFNDGTQVTYQAHIDMRTREGTCVPWLASQSDLLTIDWIIMEN